MSLTIREVLEDIQGVAAMQALMEKRSDRQSSTPDEDDDPQPILTGDPVWDAIEMAEWDPAHDL